jgi:hypothetical protein
MSYRRRWPSGSGREPILGEGRFQVSDRGDLHRPQALGHKLRQGVEFGPKRRAGMLKLLRQPLVEILRAVKTEDAATTSIRLGDW